MDKKAAELIGLSFDQFRQVIILPQGKFEKLLTSDSKEKEDILVSIFDAGKWKILAEKYYDKAKEKKDELASVRKMIDGSLAEEGCSDLTELENKILALKTEMKTEDVETELIHLYNNYCWQVFQH